MPDGMTDKADKTEAPDSDEPTSEPAKNFLSDESALQSAQAQLEELDKFQGKSIQVFQAAHFYQDGRIIIKLQDPGALENVDEYTYQGGEWLKPVPVRLTGDGAMEDNVTPLKDMQFATIANIFGTWSEKAKTVEGAEEKEMTHAYVNINPVTAKRRWFCDAIEGTRAEYQIFFNLDGSLETYEKR